MASPAKKQQRRTTAYARDTSVVRLTRELKEHIASKGKMGESYDQILRRHFGLKPWNGTMQEKHARVR